MERRKTSAQDIEVARHIASEERAASESRHVLRETSLTPEQEKRIYYSPICGFVRMTVTDGNAGFRRSFV